MSHEDESRNVLMTEIDAGIERLSRTSPKDACPAHAHVIDGIVLLLRCQRARLNSIENVKAGSIGGAIGAICAGILIAVGRYFGF